MTLPPADVLIALLKRAKLDPSVLDVYAPEIDEYADTATLADWLGTTPATIRTDISRGRWPERAPLPGRSPLWTYRAVIEYRAARPGPGNRTNHPGAEVNKPHPETGSPSD
jgi:hypothetical protein